MDIPGTSRPPLVTPTGMSGALVGRAASTLHLPTASAVGGQGCSGGSRLLPLLPRPCVPVPNRAPQSWVDSCHRPEQPDLRYSAGPIGRPRGAPGPLTQRPRVRCLHPPSEARGRALLSTEGKVRARGDTASPGHRLELAVSALVPCPADLGHPHGPCLPQPQSLGPIGSKAGPLLALLVSVNRGVLGTGLAAGGTRGCTLPFALTPALGWAEGFLSPGVAASRTR